MVNVGMKAESLKLNMENEDMKQTELHEKAVRLVEGSVVEIKGLFVRMYSEKYIFDPCLCCEMDCLCHHGNDICNLCEECDAVSGRDCFLAFAAPEPVG